MVGSAEPGFVGRRAAVDLVRAAAAELTAGQSRVVLVSGQAGMGKTTLVTHALSGTDTPTVWGVATAAEGAPAYWPWTQVLNALVTVVGRDAAQAAAGSELDTLSAVITMLGPPSVARSAAPPQDRLLMYDALTRWLTAVSADRPVVLVLDDLHWADGASLELLDHLTRVLVRLPVGFVGLYRDDELGPQQQALLASLAARGEHLPLTGLRVDEVGALLGHLLPKEVALRWTEQIFRRTGGRPFFVRELAAALREEPAGNLTQVPTAVQDAISARAARLSAPARATLDAAAVLGGAVRVEVLAKATGRPVAQLHDDVEAACALGLLVSTVDRLPRFAHDLIREALEQAQSVQVRRRLHAMLAGALAAAAERSPAVTAAEVARHCVAAIDLVGYELAVRWARSAAAEDAGRLAFTEAAGHLGRVRQAAERMGVDLPHDVRTDLLLAEADALGRSGDPVTAQECLAQARVLARRSANPGRLAEAAYGLVRLGARFAMPRDVLVEVLEEALQAIEASDPEHRARLSATLARELAHSIPAHRVRAGPLSETALELGEATQTPAVVLACLLARHDVLWTPGEGPARAEIAQRIVALAADLGDSEQRAEGMLLVANALLESGSLEFRDALGAAVAAYEALGQPRHHYFALTRRAALALLDGDLEGAEGLIGEAAELGEHIHEPDVGNVRMSQRLALVQLRADPAEQRAFAAEAVEWWRGAQVHAHAVAAGFLARAGELEPARAELATVLELGGWQRDRSYLWSVFVAQLADAAAAVEDVELSGRLFADLEPLSRCCAVNGAVVAFGGSLAHAAGVAAAAAGRPDRGRTLLDQAIEVHERLGAVRWADRSRVARVDLGAAAEASNNGVIRRTARGWSVAYRGRSAEVTASKGWTDIATLISRPGEDTHALELAGSGVQQGDAGQAADRTAIAAYRRRLRDLEDEVTNATANNDLGRADRLSAERDALVAELGRVTGIGGRPRGGSASSAERARKAVTARIRDAIGKLQSAHPQAAASLDRCIVTGTWCRYRPEERAGWRVEGAGDDRGR